MCMCMCMCEYVYVCVCLMMQDNSLFTGSTYFQLDMYFMSILVTCGLNPKKKEMFNSGFEAKSYKCYFCIFRIVSP